MRFSVEQSKRKSTPTIILTGIECPLMGVMRGSFNDGVVARGFRRSRHNHGFLSFGPCTVLIVGKCDLSAQIGDQTSLFWHLFTPTHVWKDSPLPIWSKTTPRPPHSPPPLSSTSSSPVHHHQCVTTGLQLIQICLANPRTEVFQEVVVD